MPGSTRTPVQTQSEKIRRLAGVDLAQLLRDIGEASVSTSPTELFRLCLQAQRALADVRIGSAPASASGAAALLASFDSMDREGQDRLTTFAKHLQPRFPRQRAALTLVKFGQARTCALGGDHA